MDLEATAELPIIDFDAVADGTDTFVTLSSPVVPDLSESLRDVEAHLKRKTERLRELEGQLLAVEAAQKELRADLESERRAASEQVSAERRSTAELLERERKASAEQLEHERRAATAQLEAERKSAVDLLERTRKEALTQLENERAAAVKAAEELNRRLTAAERALAETRGSFDGSQGELATTRTRLAEHEQLVAELRQSTARQTVELRHQARDLGELRRRTERQEESLRHGQGFRGVLESMLADREHTLAGIESRYAAELAANAAQANSQQQQSSEREAKLRAEAASSSASMQQAHEQRVAQLIAQHAARETELITEHAAREAQLSAGHTAREAQLHAERSALESGLGAELAAMRASTAERIAELEASLLQRTEELASTQRKLADAERQSTAQAAEILACRAEIETQLQELAVLRETDEAARAGVAVFEQQDRRIEEQGHALASTQQQAARLDQELKATLEKVSRLETDARASMSLLGNLQQNIARLGREDTGARPALKLIAAGAQLPDRVLIGKQHGEEVTHVLGRRTSIGRTPDNEIQIDASYVSRHHAVLLGSEQQCIIEDLDSMNGVSVNGRRITRHALRDGDVVKIGRSVFRYRQMG